MKARIYKALLNGKETMDSYTIWLKPTKIAVARDNACIAALCCNVIGEKVWGYWENYSPNTRVGLDVSLGKRQKLDSVPTAIRKHAQYLERIWNEACETGDWSRWNNL